MIAAMILAAIVSAAGVTDGSCTDSAQPQISSIGTVVGEALAKTPVVYRDGGAAKELPVDEQNRRETAINRATKVRDVPALEKQIGNGRCAAIALAGVMRSFEGRQPSLDDIVAYAKSQGWTQIGELNGPQIIAVAEHYGYSGSSRGGLPAYESIAKDTSNDQPLLVGVVTNRTTDPTLSQYPAHMIVVTGVTEVDGIRYVVGSDPNYPDERAWRYDDLSSATNETITVRPR